MVVLIHGIIILLIYVSPFVLQWQVLLILIISYYLQLLLLGNCLLTMWQFNEATRDTSYYSFVLEKFGFRPDKGKVRIIVDYYVPWLILAAALIWQVLLKKEVPLHLI